MCAASLVLTQPTVTEIFSWSSLTTVSVKWSAPPVDISIVKYYAFQVQYRPKCGEWIRVATIFDFTTNGQVEISLLKRNILYEFQILALRRILNLTVIDYASNTTDILTRN